MKFYLRYCMFGLCLALGACSSSGGLTRVTIFEDEDAAPLVEDVSAQALMASLPQVPDFSQTLRFEPESNVRTVFEYGVDPASIRIDSAGGFVRFTLFRVSDAGAQNITYETLRCPAAQGRTIAIANANGSWAQAQNDDWRDLRYRAGMYGQYFLLKGIFCQGGGVAGKTSEDLQKRLKNWQKTSDLFGER